MLETLFILAAAALLTLAFGLLALSQERHWENVTGTPGPTPARRRRHRGLAVACISAALPLCLFAAGTGLSSLLWAFLCFAEAFAMTSTLTWWPRGLSLLAVSPPRFTNNA